MMTESAIDFNSILKTIFMQHQRGEIDSIEWNLSCAVWTVNNLHKYPPMPYPTLPPGLIQYIDKRYSDESDMDTHSYFLLSKWAKKTREAISENETNYNLMSWCIEKLSEHAGMDESVNKLQTHMNKLNINLMPCVEYVAKSDAVLQKDMYRKSSFKKETK